MPMERPLSFQCKGTDMAGFPVKFAMTPEYTTVLALTSRARSGSSSVVWGRDRVAGPNANEYVDRLRTLYKLRGRWYPFTQLDASGRAGEITRG